MFISLLAAIERSSGKCVILASAGNAAVGGDASKVADKYKPFLAGDDAGAKLRSKYSAVLYMQDNVVRAQHQFPDLAAVEKQQQKTQDRSDALEALASAQAAHAELAAKAEAAAKALQTARNAAAAVGIQSIAPAQPEHPAVAEAAALREQLAKAEAAKAEAEAKAAELASQPPSGPAKTEGTEETSAQ